VAAAEDSASGNGHGYFIKSPWVSTDLLLALAWGGSPSERGLNLMADSAVWEFSGDYPREIQRLAGEMASYPR
jgi:hypothetical protein